MVQFLDKIHRQAWRGLLTAMALTGFLLTAWTSVAFAEPVKTENVTSELISETVTITPGQTFLVGLHQVVRPHWHTYWKNPGDSGEPTRIEWQLPDGFSAGDIQWPVPKRIDVEHLTNFGFEDEYVLLTEVRAPATLKPGTTANIRAKATWLVCEEICIPEEATLELVLTATGDKPVSDPLWADKIAQAVTELPPPSPWQPSVGFIGDRLILTIEDAGLVTQARTGLLTNAFFYPDLDGVVDHAADQTLRVSDKGISLELPKGFQVSDAADLDQWHQVNGVIVLNDESLEGTATAREGFTISANIGELAEADLGELVASGASKSGGGGVSLIQALFFGLLGGIILNLMPCVFPILSMKALNFVQKADKELGTVRMGGMAYAAGVIISFLVIGGAIYLLREAGEQVGLGFQLQAPVFVALLAYLIFIIGLNLSGVFEFSGLGNIGSGLAKGSGIVGSFWTGVLAVVVATPCTAPFMATALGYTLTQSAAVGLLVFASLGVGLALPYLILTFSPGLIRLLPKPGNWMVTFRQFLAFPMYATAAWLVWILSAQIRQFGLGQILTGFILLGFAAWIYEKCRNNQAASARITGMGTVAASIVVSVLLAQAGGQSTRPAGQISEASSALSASVISYQPYSPEALRGLRDHGMPVFVNFTADWCITCKVNEANALNRPQVIDKIKEYGVATLKGDWTSKDEIISQALNSFGRLGVPLYVIYPKGMDRKPVILPQILSRKTVIAHLEKYAQ